MQEVNDLINYFKNITETKIVDITIASIVIILFWLLSSVFSYCVIKAFMKGKKATTKTCHPNGAHLLRNTHILRLTTLSISSVHWTTRRSLMKTTVSMRYVRQ